MVAADQARRPVERIDPVGPDRRPDLVGVAVLLRQKLIGIKNFGKK